MNLLKRYENVEKIMPYNAKKLATNIKPEIRFEGENAFINYEYFYKGEIKSKEMVVNLKTLDTHFKKKRMPDFTPEPFHPDRSNLSVSPDHKYGICSFDNNILLKNMKTGSEVILTEDGNDDYQYATAFFKGAFQEFKEENGYTSCLWSKDNKKCLVDILISKNIGTLTLTQVFNKKGVDAIHPVDYVYKDWFPFEEESDLLHNLCVVDVKTKKVTYLKKENFHFDPFKPLFISAKWDDDSNGFIFVEGDKCCKKKTLYHVNLSDMTPLYLASETTETFFDDSSIHGPIYNDFGFGIHVLKDGRIIWYSQCEDMGALYFYDTLNDKLGKRITSLDYNVSNILLIDEKNEVIYFTASCLSYMSEPYFSSLGKINFDGTGLELYSKEDAMHYFKVSPDGKTYFDTYSTVDAAPITRVSHFDSLPKEIIKADISKLLRQGFILPKRTKVTLDDGTTLYGLIVLPKDYDETKKYPVVDYIYGGMQLVNTPKSFQVVSDIPGREAYGGLIGFAHLGFIGVIIDGRGTPYRGKKFHDLSYRHMGDCSGLKDHPEFIKKLKNTYKGMDLDRVGIWGNSAGGYASTRAMLWFPDFYKVAVSSAGDHDNTIYNATWALRYHGPWDKDAYIPQDNARLVENLKGHLMLVHGLLDDNVHPSETFRMIEYFQKANKDVDLMVLPDTDHNCPGNTYFQRRRFDYFVKYLMGENPPREFEFSPLKKN